MTAEDPGRPFPPWLPEWDGAQDLARTLDTAQLAADVDAIVDLVLAEDTRYLDALPGPVESALIVPLSLLAGVRETGDDVQLVVGARLVRRSARAVLDQCPGELREVLLRLPL